MSGRQSQSRIRGDPGPESGPGSIACAVGRGGRAGMALLLLVWAVSACSDTAGPVRVASVRIEPSAAERVVGQMLQLRADALDGSGKVLVGRTVTWTSDKPLIASVDGNGTVMMVSPGMAIITASCEGMAATVVVTVMVVPVASVDVQPAAATLALGDTMRLTALARDSAGNALSGRTILWSSADSAIAPVNDEGRVTAVSPGVVTITAAIEGREGNAQVTVSDPCEPTGARRISIGQTIADEIRVTDRYLQSAWYDLYRFTISSATTVLIELRSPAFDAYLYLLDGLVVIATDDDSGDGMNARIVRWLSPGTYYIVATSRYVGTGPYTLSLHASPAAVMSTERSSAAAGTGKAEPPPLRFQWREDP